MPISRLFLFSLRCLFLDLFLQTWVAVRFVHSWGKKKGNCDTACPCLVPRALCSVHCNCTWSEWRAKAAAAVVAYAIHPDYPVSSLLIRICISHPLHFATDWHSFLSLSPSSFRRSQGQTFTLPLPSLRVPLFLFRLCLDQRQEKGSQKFSFRIFLSLRTHAGESIAHASSYIFTLAKFKVNTSSRVELNSIVAQYHQWMMNYWLGLTVAAGQTDQRGPMWVVRNCMFLSSPFLALRCLGNFVSGGEGGREEEPVWNELNFIQQADAAPIECNWLIALTIHTVTE